MTRREGKAKTEPSARPGRNAHPGQKAKTEPNARPERNAHPGQKATSPKTAENSKKAAKKAAAGAATAAGAEDRAAEDNMGPARAVMAKTAAEGPIQRHPAARAEIRPVNNATSLSKQALVA